MRIFLLFLPTVLLLVTLGCQQQRSTSASSAASDLSPSLRNGRQGETEDRPPPGSARVVPALIDRLETGEHKLGLASKIIDWAEYKTISEENLRQIALHFIDLRDSWPSEVQRNRAWGKYEGVGAWERYQNNFGAWSSGWSKIIDTAKRMGVIGDRTWMHYLRHVYSINLAGRAKWDPTRQPLRVRFLCRSALVPSTPARKFDAQLHGAWRLGPYLVVDTPVESDLPTSHQGWGGITSLPADAFLGPNLGETGIKPGRYTLSFQGLIDIRMGQRKNATRQFTLPVHKTMHVEVVEPGKPVVRWVSDPSRKPEVKTGNEAPAVVVKPWSWPKDESHPEQEPFVNLHIANNSVGLACRVWIRDKKGLINYGEYIDAVGWPSHWPLHKGPIGKDRFTEGQTVDLILEPSRDVARKQPDLRTAWAKPIVIKDVKVAFDGW